MPPAWGHYDIEVGLVSAFIQMIQKALRDSRVLEFLDDPVGVELRTVLHVTDEWCRSRFLTTVKQGYHQEVREAIPVAYHRDPSPCSSSFTNRGKVVTIRSVLLLAIMFRPEIIDSADCRLNLGKVRKQVLRGCWFGAGRCFLDEVSLSIT